MGRASRLLAELLTSANAGNSSAMEQARMRGLQLMAAEQRALLGV